MKRADSSTIHVTLNHMTGRVRFDVYDGDPRGTATYLCGADFDPTAEPDDGDAEIIAACAALVRRLAGRRTIARLFADRFGVPSSDPSLHALDIETPCGRDCVRAIDAAMVLLEPLDSRQPEWAAIVEATDAVIQVLWRG